MEMEAEEQEQQEEEETEAEEMEMEMEMEMEKEMEKEVVGSNPGSAKSALFKNWALVCLHIYRERDEEID